MVEKGKEHIKVLEDVASKYSLTTIKEKICKIQESSIKIGFLGEFNSGKSSLINALLGRRILPVMERPTTKNIITIVPDRSVKSLKFYKKENGKILEIEPLDFQEIALGRKEGNAVVKVPPSEYIPEGFQIVDTPGIASLEKTDIEITLGYLPELDAAVVCQDITFGTFPKSVLDFLKRPEVKVMADKIVFTLTKADRIVSEEVEKAKEHAISVIQEFYDSIGVKLNAKQRVFVTSAKLSLEGKKEYIKEFLEGLKREIIAKKEELKRERLKKESKKLAKELIEILTYMKSKAKPEISEIEEEIRNVEKEISSLKLERKRLEDKVNDIERDIYRKAEWILRAYKTDLLSASDEKELNQVISRMEQELQRSIENLLRRKLKVDGDASLSVKDAIQRIREEIVGELKKIELVKTALTVALFVVAGPGRGAANVAEGVVGYLATKFTKVLGGLGKVLGTVGKFLKELNPAEIIVNPLAKKRLESKYSELIPLIAGSIAENSSYEIREILEETFKELEDKIEAKKEALRKLRDKKLMAIEHVKKFKEEIEQDIVTLKDIAQ